MKRLVLVIAKTVKWFIVAAIRVVILGFLAVTTSNFILYGRLREGGRAVYDPYTLFLQAEGIRPTANNSHSQDKEKSGILWLFGGSTMRGATPYDDKTIPSFLATFLNYLLVVPQSWSALVKRHYVDQLQKCTVEDPQCLASVP